MDNLNCGSTDGIAYWGFSQRGESHLANGIPCQDRCLIEVIDDPLLIVSAIADGVGSCVLSHYGAETATRSAVEFIKKELINHDGKLDDDYIGDLLRKAMQCACDAVKRQAAEIEQLEYSFQSTLTLAIYDGSTLYFSHAGDDGIVAILDDGKMDMVTTRKKGEEASSVYPLQSMEWETRKSTDVNAFIMATDGVLDAFVRGEKEGNRIYFPFIGPAISPGQNTDSKIKEIADLYYNYMESAEYRSQVTDDLTLVVVTNQTRLNESNIPEFSQEAWDELSRKREAQIKAALYPDTEPVQPPSCDIKLEDDFLDSEQSEKTVQGEIKVPDINRRRRDPEPEEPLSDRSSPDSKNIKSSGKRERKGERKKREKSKQVTTSDNEYWKAPVILIVVIIVIMIFIEVFFFHF